MKLPADNLQTGELEPSDVYPAKWTVLSIWCAHLAQPHDKFCITIDAAKGWFLFINSEPPAFRKAKKVAVEISNFEATFLKHTSYVDTTNHEELSEAAVSAALADPDRNRGPLLRSVQERIREMVASHEAMPPEARAIILG